MSRASADSARLFAFFVRPVAFAVRVVIIVKFMPSAAGL